MIHKLYARLSDPITIFSISGEFTRHSIIPLSEDTRRAVEAQIREVSDDSGLQPDYEAELLNDDIRGGTVTCAALSQDGKYVAFGFGNGTIEITDIDQSCTVSQFRCEPPNLLPVWIEFIHGDCRIAVEDNQGNITIFGSGSPSIKLDQLCTGGYPPITMVSRDQSMIARGSYSDMSIIYVLEDSSIHRLTTPTPQQGSWDNLPHRRSIGFSPGGRYLGAFNCDHAVIWSTDSRALIAYYQVPDFTTWIMNMRDDLSSTPHSYLIPIPIFGGRPSLSHDTSIEGSCEPEEEWLHHPFLDLTPSVRLKGNPDYSIYSSITGKVPILSPPSSLGWATLWFNGQVELTIPAKYSPLIVSESNNKTAWYGDRILPDAMFHPRSSKDGSRILLQGRARAPIIVDISGVI